MASQSKSILTPSLAVNLAALQSVRRAKDAKMASILTELAAIPAELVARAGQEIARAAGLGWWHRRPVQLVSADTLLGKLLRKLDARSKLRPSAQPSEWDLLNANPDCAWILLFHPSGFLREAALNAVKILPAAPFFSAALAVRLNDWVPQVRAAAKRCLQRVSSQIETHIAVDVASYLLTRRFVWERWRDEASVLDEIFARDDVLAALAAKLEVRANGAVRGSLRQAMRFPRFDRHLPRLAANALQPSVRAVAYQSLISAKVSWPIGFEWVWVDKIYNRRRRVPILQARDLERARALDDVLADGARDKSAFVRKIVAEAMIAVRSEIANEAPLVARLAADRSAAVRSRADFMLRHPLGPQVK